MKYLYNNEDHCMSCFYRWRKRRNRDVDSPDYKAEWYDEQCFACVFFIPLGGCLADDYGLCSCEKSQYDGLAMFEHDGCDAFIKDEDS